MVGNRVCAAVVAFHPDAEFESRIAVVLPQVEHLLVIDNTPESARTRRIQLPVVEGQSAHLIENADNAGLGSALNQALDFAQGEGFDWLLTLDQDTRCYGDQVITLLEAVAQARPAVVGSNYLDTRNGLTKVPVSGAGAFVCQKTVITSGSLIDVRFAAAIGGFRADYFIDQIDHEFCLRARAKGGGVVICRKPVMEHSVGEEGGVRLPLLGRLPNSSPLRKYYVARNSLVTIANYWRSDSDWCLRRAVRLFLGVPLMALCERQGWPKFRAFLAGVADATRGRMGPCRHSFK
ncbi:MAG: glycosyltransferase [Betaproteobacteria bacterium]|nr:glycosyltransferase [Betaproteobacteria bacterium]